MQPGYEMAPATDNFLDKISRLWHLEGAGAMPPIPTEPSSESDSGAQRPSASGAEPGPGGTVDRPAPKMRPLTEPSPDDTQIPDSFDLRWQDATRRAIPTTDTQIPATRLQPHSWSRGAKLDRGNDR